MFALVSISEWGLAASTVIKTRFEQLVTWSALSFGNKASL
jgi:hypothetical protein